MDDGPKMNLKFFNEHSSKFAENTLHSLINIGICNQQLLFMGASKLVNLHLNGVWKILWRVLIEFYVTVLHEGKITPAWLDHQSIRLTFVQQGTICYKPFIILQIY